MKTALSAISVFFLVMLIMSVPSCTKDSVSTVVKNDTLIKNDTVVINHTVIVIDTIKAFIPDNSFITSLTGKQWVFDSLITNYYGTGTGILAYKRGASNNSNNLDNARGMYWPDGTQELYDNFGHYYPGTFSFPNPSDSTIFSETNSGGTLAGRIIRLDATHFTFFDTIQHNLNIEVYKP